MMNVRESCANTVVDHRRLVEDWSSSIPHPPRQCLLPLIIKPEWAQMHEIEALEEESHLHGDRLWLGPQEGKGG